MSRCLSPDVKQALIQWQERIDFAHKLLTLLNSYSPPELRNACLGEPQSLWRLLLCCVCVCVCAERSVAVADVLKELVLLSPHDFLHTLVPFLQHNHCTYHHSNIPSESTRTASALAGVPTLPLSTSRKGCVFVSSVSFGPYLPCRENIKLMGAKSNIRPPRPELNMCLLPSMVESRKVRLAAPQPLLHTSCFCSLLIPVCVCARVRARVWTGKG